MFYQTILGSAAYIDGSLTYCGGVNIQDKTGKSVKNCYSLRYPAPRWEETFPLLQVRKVVNNWANKSACTTLFHKLTSS